MFSSFSLRALALVCMLVDHAALAFLANVPALRAVGRLAFPLYCFLLTEGFLHTRDIGAYFRRLLLCAILSEIPFDLLLFGTHSSPAEQNVLFSLLFALCSLYLAQSIRSRPFVQFSAQLVLIICAMLTRVSYGPLGILLCLGFFYTRPKRMQPAALIACELLYCAGLAVSGVDLSWCLVSLCAVFASIPIALYSGRRGPHQPVLTALFYAAYPVHMLLFALIRHLRLIPPYLFP